VRIHAFPTGAYRDALARLRAAAAEVLRGLELYPLALIRRQAREADDPRLAFGFLSITDDNSFEPTTERTLVTQLGLRSKFEVPVDERLAILLTFAAQRTLGVYALTHYTGLDEGLNGWVVSWSLGLGVEP
jgi:hypothetical protein